MYESPIEVCCTMDDVFQKINEGTGNEVYEAVVRVGVNVHKDELIKALRYDRNQYEKGYVDGIKEFAEKLCEGRESDNSVVIAVNTELKRMEVYD